MAKRFYLQWHITNRCENRCKHCYITDYNQPDVDWKTSQLILQDFSECCEKLEVEPHLVITGGDPILHPRFWDILSLARENCKWVGILGNPEKLDDRTIAKLKKIGIDRYQLSLDGMETTHDSIRLPGSFQSTTKAISRLSQAGISVSVMSTVSFFNYQEMINVMQLSYQLGAKHWSFARWTPQNGDCGILPNEFVSFLRKIETAHKLFEKKGVEPQNKESLLILIRRKSCNIGRQDLKIQGGCGIGTSTLTILPDNTVMACRRHSGSVLEKWTPQRGFLSIFLKNSKLKDYRRIDKIEGCKDCQYLYYCRGCRAAAYASTGNHFGKDPQCPMLLK